MRTELAFYSTRSAEKSIMGLTCLHFLREVRQLHNTCKGGNFAIFLEWTTTAVKNYEQLKSAYNSLPFQNLLFFQETFPK